jgi:hypothetical protein
MEDEPRKEEMMARETMMRTSLPWRKKTSQTRSWVWKGRVVQKRVMYHLVAKEEVEIISFFYRLSRSGSNH